MSNSGKYKAIKTLAFVTALITAASGLAFGGALGVYANENCYIRFGAAAAETASVNLSFNSGETPMGTYGTAGGLPAYTTATGTGGETYLYCYLGANSGFSSSDTSATIVITYFSPQGSSGNALEIWYHNRNGSNTWSAMQLFKGDGRWSTAYIYLSSVNFTSLVNGANFRITAKSPTSISYVSVEHGRVTDPGGNLTGLSLDKTSASIQGYGNLKLNYIATPETATVGTVTWSSSNPGVAIVGSSGHVIAYNIGSTTITASTPGAGGVLTASCNITVTAVPAEGVEIIPASLDLKVSEGKMLSYWVTPASATDKTVRWASGDESVATVTRHGYVTAVAPGETVITATTKDGGFAAECPVTVYPLENSGVVARSAADFLMSIGVCSHVGQGDSVARTISALNYMGVRVVRDDCSASQQNNFLNIAAQTGVKYLMVNSGPNENSIQTILNVSRALANQGSLLAFEGPNEPNNWAVNYYGAASGNTADNRANEAALSMWQRDFYIAVKSDPQLKSYPVFGSSEAGGSEYTNIGQQFLTIPEGAGTRFPDGTQFADYANVHNYLGRINNVCDNMAWLCASPDNESLRDPVTGGSGGVDGIYQEYGRTWRSGGGGPYNGYTASLERQQLPKVTTETGWASVGPGVTSSSALSQDAQGKLFLNTYLSQFARGFDHTFIYYLLDASNQDTGMGFYDINGAAKNSARYLHNLTAILDDGGAADILGDVNYAIPNQPATVHDLLLQKSGGVFELALWNERAGNSSVDRPITVDLGAVYANVKVYDPTIGEDAVSELGNVSSVPLTLTDHPLILEFEATGVDKTALDALIVEVSSEYDSGALFNRTADSVDALLEALRAAKAVSESAEASQEDVDSAYDALLKAFNELEDATLTCAAKSMLAKIGKLQRIPFEWDGSGQPWFTSSNPAVCVVTEDGTLVPLKAGISVITITAPGGAKIIFAVTVSA